MVNAFRKRARDVYGPPPFRQEHIGCLRQTMVLRARSAGPNPPAHPGEPVLGHANPPLAGHEGRNDAGGGG